MRRISRLRQMRADEVIEEMLDRIRNGDAARESIRMAPAMP